MDNWVFGDKRANSFLPKYSWTKIERHIKVKGTASPDDPNLKEYWKERTTAKAGKTFMRAYGAHIAPYSGPR